jgi:hypothetical protein
VETVGKIPTFGIILRPTQEKPTVFYTYFCKPKKLKITVFDWKE